MVEEQLVCFECNKPIDCLAQAPSGSFLPRCKECNAKRWEQHMASETEQQGRVSHGVHVVDPGDYDEDIDGEDDGEWGL